MSQEGKRENTLENRIDTFRKHGPYTFERALALAKQCARGDRLQVGDHLDDISHKFPTAEFVKLLDAEKLLSGEDVKAWRKGAEGWSFGYLNQQHTDAQLQELAKRPHLWDGIVDNMQMDRLSTDTFFTLLKDFRKVARNTGRDDSVERS